MSELNTGECPECGSHEVVEMNDYWSDKYYCYITEMICYGCMHEWKVKMI